MKASKLLCLLTLGAITSVLGVVALTERDNETFAIAHSSTFYHCASIHFGMSDSDLSGTATLTGGTISVGEHEGSIGEASGIEVLEYTVSNQAVYMVDGCGLKFSSSSKNSTVTFSLGSEIVGCDIYAVGWNKDSAYLTVNDDDSSKTKITSLTSVTGSGTVDVTYQKYHFDFDQTSDLVISATKRIVIGDIALRVAN